MYFKSLSALCINSMQVFHPLVRHDLQDNHQMVNPLQRNVNEKSSACGCRIYSTDFPYWFIILYVYNNIIHLNT